MNTGGPVFISYAHSPNDDEYIRHLSKTLQAKGIPSWFDRGIEPGDRWERVIRSQIDSCCAMIVVMTPEAGQSAWVKREINLAEDLEKPIFPILLRGERFWHLSDLQYADVRDGARLKKRFISAVREAVAKGADGRTTPGQSAQRLAPVIPLRDSTRSAASPTQDRRGSERDDAADVTERPRDPANDAGIVAATPGRSQAPATTHGRVDTEQQPQTRTEVDAQTGGQSELLPSSTRGGVQHPDERHEHE